MHPIVEELLNAAENAEGREFEDATYFLSDFMYINLGDNDMEFREGYFVIPPPEGLPQIVLTWEEKKEIVDRVSAMIQFGNLIRNSWLLGILCQSPGELAIDPIIEITERLQILKKSFFDDEFHNFAAAIDNFLFRFNYENDINNSEYVESLTSPPIYAVVDTMMRTDHRFPGYSQERAIQIQYYLKILELTLRGEERDEVYEKEWDRMKKYQKLIEKKPSIIERLKQGESLDDIFPDEEE
jgi:hypothetical protein